MAVRQPRYSKEEFARRGDEIYESQVRSQVEEGNHGKIVAIDIETGAFEVDASEIAACDRLEARYPDLRSGSFAWVLVTVRRFGGRTRRTA
ncbi:MAG: hypothetical protein HC780_24445 [Leptolyngbyaceae cyanobacterium CSU_1_3]|nr:hypothetical protein [Leptolyngbyaceae cyanobacterium CSU_1_3]